MKEQILSIASDLREGSMSTDEAVEQLLLLLNPPIKSQFNEDEEINNILP